MLKGKKISKKLAMASVSAIVILIADLLGIKLDDATLHSIVALIVGYCIAQGYVDKEKEKQNGKVKENSLKNTLKRRKGKGRKK